MLRVVPVPPAPRRLEVVAVLPLLPLPVVEVLVVVWETMVPGGIDRCGLVVCRWLGTGNLEGLVARRPAREAEEEVGGTRGGGVEDFSEWLSESEAGGVR